MNIDHRPIFDIEKVINHYEEKDGVPITYVCTSAVNMGTLSCDIFYRTTPHPDFGNRYFGLYHNPYSNNATIMITNADKIEELEFVMVEIDGKLHYSQHRHDFYEIGDCAIDGGRAYFKRLGNLTHPTKVLKIKNGTFVDGD